MMRMADIRMERRSPGRLMPAMRARFAQAVRAALKAKPHMVVGLPGGRSLEGLFDKPPTGLGPGRLSQVLFVPADERVGPAGHANSNARHLKHETLAPLVRARLITPTQIVALDTGKMLEEGKTSAELGRYSRALRSLAPDGMDLLVLGVGEDGHIASLFPGHPALKDKGSGWIEIRDAPKPPPRRATMPPEAIAGAKEVWLVFRGEGKRGALGRFLDARVKARDCPAKLALGAKRVRVWTDLAEE